MSAIITDTCPRGGFFDGNENFGGPPYRVFMALLCAAPTIFAAISCSYWVTCLRKQQQRTQTPQIQHGSINYQSITRSSSTTTTPSSSSELPSPSLNVDDHPFIDVSLYCESPSASPNASNSVHPSEDDDNTYNHHTQTIIPAPSSLSSLELASSSMSASLLSTASPQPDSSPDNNNNNHNNNSNDNNIMLMPESAPISRRTRFLLFCRALIRPKPLFSFTAVYSIFQFSLIFTTLIYGMSAGEQCCYGGTGALYSILCLRLCLSYTNVRVGYWQTHSASSVISAIEKSCQIGYLIHFIWLSFAFILIADDGQCSTGAPIMYTVSFISIILLLINYIIFAIFTVLSFVYHSKNDLIIVLSRTAIKSCLIGWSYGKELDLNDAITDVEMEIACLPCVTLPQMIIREQNKIQRRQAYINNNTQQLSVKIDDLNNNTTINNNNETVVGNKNNDGEIETLSCSICLCPYENDDMIRPLPCGHHLHKTCSDAWLKVKSTCPLCVRSVLVQ